MNNTFLLIIKGFFVGLAKIIPGVSGATLAITLGLYERSLDAISNFHKKWKENTAFLLPIAIGVGLAIILASKLIKVALVSWYVPTMLLFIGLICGGIPALSANLKKKDISKKNCSILFLSFGAIFLFSLFSIEDGNTFQTQMEIPSFITLILLGVLEAATIVIPGISGTGIMMILGYYDLLINTFSNLTNLSLFSHHIKILLPFGIGVFLGVFIIAKLMSFLFQYFKKETYIAVFGFTLASIAVLFLQTIQAPFTISELFIAILLFFFGFIAAYKLE